MCSCFAQAAEVLQKSRLRPGGDLGDSTPEYLQLKIEKDVVLNIVSSTFAGFEDSIEIDSSTEYLRVLWRLTV